MARCHQPIATERLTEAQVHERLQAMDSARRHPSEQTRVMLVWQAYHELLQLIQLATVRSSCRHTIYSVCTASMCPAELCRRLLLPLPVRLLFLSS